MHISLRSKGYLVVNCYGVTKDPSGDFMLVLRGMECDLHEYLKDASSNITWSKVYKILLGITRGLVKIHNDQIIHKDLHSGNILRDNENWYIADLGLSGPPNLDFGKVYGKLPYIAPEVLNKRKYTMPLTSIVSEC